MANKYQISVPVPFVPGSEFAGLVDCLGDGAAAGINHPTAADFAAALRAEPELARRDEGELLALLATGQARPHIGATFTPADTAAALRHVADGKAIGKVVLEIG